MFEYMSKPQPACFALQLSHSIEDVAENLGVDSRTVREWVRKGELKAVNVSRNKDSRKARLRILEKDIADFLTLRAIAPEVKISRRRRRFPPVEQIV